MKILALEFSSPQRSVAVYENGNIAQIVQSNNHKTSGLALIDEALRAAKLEREQIECVAIGLGPGSYTGIRSSIAIAQGWQLARGIKLLGASSVECLAAQLQNDDAKGRVHVVIDAQRNEFYLASYDLSKEEQREIAPLRLASMAEVQELEKAGELIVGPEVTRWFVSGKQIFPSALTVAALAAEQQNFVCAENLQPIYLRETSFVKAPPPRTF